MLDPLLGRLDLRLQLGRVGFAEVGANGGAAHIEPETRAMALQVRQVFGPRFGEVVLRQLDGVEVHGRHRSMKSSSVIVGFFRSRYLR